MSCTISWPALGQYRLNQRSFYEWFARADSLRLEVPCYASGVHPLRPGCSRIALATNGPCEFGDRPYSDAVRLYDDLAEGDLLAQTAHLSRRFMTRTVQTAQPW